MNYWLLKSDPEAYSWENLLEDKSTFWDGVRNYQARNNLKAMRRGDWALFYHSNQGKCVVGIVEITKEAYQDPTTEDERWVAVDIRPLQAFPNAVSLPEIKMQPKLTQIGLIRQSRLSVMPIGKKEFDHILKMGGIPPQDLRK